MKLPQPNLTTVATLFLGLAVPSLAISDEAVREGVLRSITSTLAAGPFKPEWASLKTHQDPDWFRDAKLGIYTHWGPVTVGAEDGPDGVQWYGNSMYKTNSPTFKYHQQKFGDQHQVGYKDIIPKFTAEKFDPEEWASLFAYAGAKFAGPVAVHHDNFAMWDSQITPWNSVATGPHRDVTGELAKAIRAHGMKFITTFHHGYAWRYYEPSFAFDGRDPRYTALYTEPHAPGAPPTKYFQDTWLAMVQEVLTDYQPDLIWFDFEFFAVITPEYQQRLFATAYNWAAQNDRTIGVCQKSQAIHEQTGILDFERGREDRLVPYPWLTDTAVGPWFYQKSEKLKSVGELVDILADIVSKNGCLLLDVAPRADGTIPPEIRQRLLGLGIWMHLNGEAIYNTRPWKVYGEGPTHQAKAGAFSENADHAYVAQDIRFTSHDKDLYAIALAVPTGPLTIHSLGEAAGKVASVTLVGGSDSLSWQQTADGLTIQPPAKWPGQYAVAFKINFQP